MRARILAFSLSILTVFGGCNETSNEGPNCELLNLSGLYSKNQDRQLGLKVAEEINSNSAEYPLLDETQYASVYTYLNGIRDKILNSGKVETKDDFEWKLKVVRNDSVQNAFCTPGGYIYIYTGILKTLESEDAFAGVLGHEIAHADRRHSIRSLINTYGLQTLLSILGGGDQNSLTTIAGNLASLKNSRCHETEADAYSVVYLSGTEYACNGASFFFEMISGQGGIEFLSTHPSPENRVAEINKKADQVGCSKALSANQQSWASFIATLP